MNYIKLSKVATIVTGGTPSTEKKEYWENGTIPWLQSGCCQDCYVYEASKFITRSGYDNSSTRMMPKDTILIALTGATAGKVGYLTFDACGNQSITGITPNKDYLPKFIYYYLKSIRKKIISDCIGGAQPHISQGYVKNIDIPIISIKQQEGIVECLNNIEKLKASNLLKLSQLDDLIKSRFICQEVV